jgi:hypothetical protein
LAELVGQQTRQVGPPTRCIRPHGGRSSAVCRGQRLEQRIIRYRLLRLVAATRSHHEAPIPYLERQFLSQACLPHTRFPGQQHQPPTSSRHRVYRRKDLAQFLGPSNQRSFRERSQEAADGERAFGRRTCALITDRLLYLLGHNLDNSDRLGKSFELHRPPLGVAESLDSPGQVGHRLARQHLTSSCQTAQPGC